MASSACIKTVRWGEASKNGVASKKGWLEISKTLNVYISASRAASEDLRPVLECLFQAPIIYYTLYEMTLVDFGIGGFSFND